MGAYLSYNWYKKIKLTFNDSYLRYMHNDAIMAVIFGDRAPLFDKIRSCSMPYDFDNITILEGSHPLYIYIDNGNLVIHN
jgi:hypothetical protein